MRAVARQSISVWCLSGRDYELHACNSPFGQLPGNLGIRHIIGIGMLGGIGFTMSIFISNPGFEQIPETLLHAKAAILTGSLIAGICSYLWLRNIHHGDRKIETG